MAMLVRLTEHVHYLESHTKLAIARNNKKNNNMRKHILLNKNLFCKSFGKLFSQANTFWERNMEHYFEIVLLREL